MEEEVDEVEIKGVPRSSGQQEAQSERENGERSVRLVAGFGGDIAAPEVVREDLGQGGGPGIHVSVPHHRFAVVEHEVAPATVDIAAQCQPANQHPAHTPVTEDSRDQLEVFPAPCPLH